jgi:hypothetical protein
VEDESVAVQLDEVDVVEGIGQGVGVPGEQVDQVIVADVARRHQEQSSRRPRQQMSIDEVTILRDDDPILDLGDSGDLAIRVRLPFGSSDVCTTSWPNSINSGTRRTGSCASTSRRIYAADVGTEVRV